MQKIKLSPFPPFKRLPQNPPNPKPSRLSSPASSGPIPNAARIAVKDGCAPSNFFRLSLGPPALRSCEGRPEPNGQEPGFYEVQDEPPRVPAPATSTDAAASPLTPSPPIDSSRLQHHTLRTSPTPGSTWGNRVMIDDTSPPEPPCTPTRRLTIPKAHSLRSSGSVQQILSAMLPHSG